MKKKVEIDNNERGYAIFLDTNILIVDPASIFTLQEGGNSVFLVKGVLRELDGLKNASDIGLDVREALKYIEQELLREDSRLFIYSGESSWSKTGLYDRSKVDNQIIAAANGLYKSNNKSNKSNHYKGVKIVSNDRTVRIFAYQLFKGKNDFFVEPYFKNERNVIRYKDPEELIISSEDYDLEMIDPEKYGFIGKENQGLLLIMESSEGKIAKQPAIYRKGMIFPISFDISACGLKPMSINGNGANWSQYFALSQLLNDEINLVFLLGGAGTGKTILALASAIERRTQYRQILVTRPMVHLEDEDNMGFLPGDVREKMGPWLKPIMQNLTELKNIKGNRELIDKMLLERKIDIEPLDYIRGTTFSRCFLIIDEAQNLTPHQMKTIISRAGEGSKVVFTGDLDQIDRRRRLNKKSSGPNNAANALEGEEIVGIVTFKDSVRSPLTQLANDKLK